MRVNLPSTLSRKESGARGVWNIQPDGAHEGQSVASRYDARAQAVVEGHTAILKLVFEMHIGRMGCEVVSDVGQRKIMSGDKPNRGAVDKPGDYRLGSQAAVVRVSALKEFVQEEQQGERPGGEAHELANAADFGIEAGMTGLEGILNAKGGADGHGAEPQRCGAHGGTRQCQHGVDADRAKECALAGHVGT